MGMSLVTVMVIAIGGGGGRENLWRADRLRLWVSFSLESGR